MIGHDNEVPVQRGVTPGARQLVRTGSNYTLFRYKEETWPRCGSDLEARLPAFALLGAGAEPEPYRGSVEDRFDAVPAAGAAAAAGTPAKPMQELVEALSEQPELLLYIHGFNNNSATVAARTLAYPSRLLQDSQAKHEAPGIGVWVSYDWPGERAFFGKTFWRAWRAGAEFARYLAVWLLLLGAPLLLLGRAVSGWPQFGAAFPTAEGLVAVPVLIAGALLFAVWLLRLTSYQRDLYMALHRGVPDLCEFLRHLDHAYFERHKTDGQDPAKTEESLVPEKRIKLHIIAHSMGAMITLNTIRILSDLFDRAPREQPDAQLGRSLEVSTLILAAADVPVELLQVGQNNYFYSALRRFERLCVFSNAHDAVLHTLGYFANSIAEPQPGRSRSRLGTVFHTGGEAQPPATAGVCARRWLRNEPVFEEAVGPVADPGLITERLTFIDCSRRAKLSSRITRLFACFPPARDLVALLLYLWVDCHAGYFDDAAIWKKMHDVIRSQMKPGERGNEVL